MERYQIDTSHWGGNRLVTDFFFIFGIGGESRDDAGRPKKGNHLLWGRDPIVIINRVVTLVTDFFYLLVK